MVYLNPTVSALLWIHYHVYIYIYISHTLIRTYFRLFRYSGLCFYIYIPLYVLNNYFNPLTPNDL
jgi:hypothetical protein